jgi:hypothetical protein
LAWTAIRAHPFRAIRDHVWRSFSFFKSMFSLTPGYMSPVPATLDSIQHYQAFAKIHPSINELTTFSRVPVESYIGPMSTRVLFPLQPGDWISKLCWPLRWLEMQIPLLVILALVFAIKQRDPIFDLISLIGLFHILMAAMVISGSNPTLRHAVPLEPLSVLLIIRSLFYWASRFPKLRPHD